jgi:hypothetical protein
MLPFYTEAQQLVWWIFFGLIASLINIVFADIKAFNKIRADNFILLKPNLIVIETIWLVLFVLTGPANYYGVQVIFMDFDDRLWIFVALVITSILISFTLFTPWEVLFVVPKVRDVEIHLLLAIFFTGASFGLSVADTIVIWLKSTWAVVFLFMSIFYLYLFFVLSNAAWTKWKPAPEQQYSPVNVNERIVGGFHIEND